MRTIARPQDNPTDFQAGPLHRRSRTLGSWFRVLIVLASIILLVPASSTPTTQAGGTTYDWLQFQGNAQHSGNNTQETTITAANVSTLQRVFQVTLPGYTKGAPVYLSAVSTALGVRDLVFVTTRNGHIRALDAHSGATIWDRLYPSGSCLIHNVQFPCDTSAGPAIDPNRQYIYAFGLDGRVHKYRTGNGNEITGGGWPELVTTKTGFEKGSANLSIATARNGSSYLYATTSSFGDVGDYQGHLTTINLATGIQHVFNALCSNQVDVHFALAPATPDCDQVQAGIWARSGVVYNPINNRIYLATGNATFDPTNYNWGDSVLALNPDGTGNAGMPLDSYTPADYISLNTNDTDLGSTDIAILPAPISSTVQQLAVQGGKDGLLRLLNLTNLSGQGGPGHTGGEIGQPIPIPQGGEMLTAAAVWTNPKDGTTWVFVGTDNGLSGLQLAVDPSGTPFLQLQWQSPISSTSPLVANNILFTAHNVTPSSFAVDALDPTMGTTLWQDTDSGTIHWESPIVANGMLYITDLAPHLTAYALGTASTSTATSTPAAISTTTPTPSPSETPIATATSTSTPTSTATSADTATSTDTATDTTTPTPTGTQTATATATNTPVAQLVINPTRGMYHQSIAVTGTNFAAAEHVGIYWDTTGSTALTTAVVTGAGGFTASILIPQAISGTHNLVALGQISGRIAGALVHVGPFISLSAPSGSQGAAEAISGAGFGPNEQVAAYWIPGNILLGTTASNGLGTFAGASAITATIPVSPTGHYQIMALGKTSHAVVSVPFSLVQLLPHGDEASQWVRSAAGTGLLR